MSSSDGDKIIKPGYHIRPKYDLHGFRRRRTDDSKGHVATELPLTSMIDMFSILVIYLLMNFSATGEIFFMNKNLTLPRAGKVNALQNAPLISIVGEEFILEAPEEYGGGGVLRDQSLALDAISGQLRTYKERAMAGLVAGGPNAQNRINVQAGEDTPIGLVKRAMTAAVTAGWTNINFVVEKTR